MCGLPLKSRFLKSVLYIPNLENRDEMEYDQNKVDEMTLALMYLVMSKDREGGRAWKGFNSGTLKRLHQKGWISEFKVKDISIGVTAEGMKKAEELFIKYFQDK
jgi:hypothetical protein